MNIDLLQSIQLKKYNIVERLIVFLYYNRVTCAVHSKQYRYRIFYAFRVNSTWSGSANISVILQPRRLKFGVWDPRPRSCSHTKYQPDQIIDSLDMQNLTIFCLFKLGSSDTWAEKWAGQPSAVDSLCVEKLKKGQSESSTFEAQNCVINLKFSVIFWH